MSTVDALPDYERPPVSEIIAAVQFHPLPVFGMREVVEVGRMLRDWEIVDTQPAIPPIVESPTGHIQAPSFNFAFGTPPLRALFASEGGRWFGQVQQDRIAVHERRMNARPSFAHVAPKLSSFIREVSAAVDRPILDEPHRPDIVEMVYENRIASSEGGWSDFADLGAVLRILDSDSGDPPFQRPEEVTLGYTFRLGEGEDMDGRLRVFAEPQRDPDGGAALQLRLVGRRFVHGNGVDNALEACHADIVTGFTAITTDNMHQVWGRLR